MKRVLLIAAIASIFSSVAFADFTIASSKKLDAKVDVVGAKDDKWCESNLSLKFLTTGGKDLSQAAYDELYPKVQTLIGSQCAIASEVTFVRGIEKTSYLVKAGDWQIDSLKVAEAVAPNVDVKPEVKSEPKSEAKVADKGSKKETKESPITKTGVEKQLNNLVDSFKSRDASYLSSITNKDFYVNKTPGSGISHLHKKDEYIAYLSNVLKNKLVNIENVSFFVDDNLNYWNNKHNITIEGIANKDGALVKYKHTLDVTMFKNNENGSYYIERLVEKVEFGDQVDASGNKVVNVHWGYKEFMALTAKKPNEIETYIGNYIVSKDNKSCMAFNQASDDLKKFNDFIASYEKEALDYKKLVESTKEAKFGYNDRLSLGEYDEKIEGYKINSIGMGNLNVKCYATKLEQPILKILVAHNVQFLKIPLRLANSIKGEQVAIELTFEPRITEHKGKLLQIVSSKHTKIVHEKSGTVLFDEDIPESIYTSAPDEYLKNLEKAQKERDANKKKMSASECEQIRWFGGKCD